MDPLKPFWVPTTKNLQHRLWSWVALVELLMLRCGPHREQNPGCALWLIELLLQWSLKLKSRCSSNRPWTWSASSGSSRVNRRGRYTSSSSRTSASHRGRHCTGNTSSVQTLVRNVGRQRARSSSVCCIHTRRNARSDANKWSQVPFMCVMCCLLLYSVFRTVVTTEFSHPNLLRF